MGSDDVQYTEELVFNRMSGGDERVFVGENDTRVMMSELDESDAREVYFSAHENDSVDVAVLEPFISNKTTGEYVIIEDEEDDTVYYFEYVSESEITGGLNMWVLSVMVSISLFLSPLVILSVLTHGWYGTWRQLCRELSCS